MQNNGIINTLIVGTGEYVTGIVHGNVSKSDKNLGVIALVMFHLRATRPELGLNRILLCGTSGTKFPNIRKHFEQNIAGVYSDIQNVEFESYPEDHVQSNPKAYLDAMNTLNANDIVIIVTPDQTHYEIAREALKRKLHVLCAKPIVQKLEHHLELAKESKQNELLCCVEVHKVFFFLHLFYNQIC